MTEPRHGELHGRKSFSIWFLSNTSCAGFSSATRPKPCLHLLLSFCCESHGGEDEKKRKGRKKQWQHLVPAVGTTAGPWSTTGKELIFMASSLPGKQQWQEAHTPWHSQHPLHMSARRGASSCCLPGPHNLDRHRFCAGTGALSQSCLPRVTGGHSSPGTRQENTGAQECWCSAEWTVLPLHSSEKLHSGPEKGLDTQYMQRLQHQHALVDLHVRWQFSTKIIFCILDSLVFSQKSCHLSKKSWLFFLSASAKGLQHLAWEHHCCAFSEFGLAPHPVPALEIRCHSQTKTF